jgi:hypothetical protein
LGDRWFHIVLFLQFNFLNASIGFRSRTHSCA